MKRVLSAILALFVIVSPVAAQFWEANPAILFEDIEDLLVLPSGDVLAIVDGDGIYRSTDSGTSFVKVFDVSYVRELAFGTNRIFAAGLSGTFVSDDNGLTWNQLLPSDVWGVSAIGSDIALRGSASILFNSTDNGATWTIPNVDQIPYLESTSVRAAVRRGALVGYKTIFSDLMVSTDGGANWATVDVIDPDVIHDINGLFYADRYDEVWTSTDLQNWNQLGTGSGVYWDDLAVSNDAIAVAGDFSGLAVSINGGNSWINLSDDLGTNRIVSITFLSDGKLLVGTDFSVYKTSISIENKRPVSNDMDIVTNEDTSIDFTIDASDIFGDPLSIEVVTPPTRGQLVIIGLQATYGPAEDVNGVDQFTYVASDGILSDTATVTIIVNAVNDPPIPTSVLVYETDEDAALVVDAVSGVLSGALDPEGDVMEAILNTDVSEGAVVLASDGSFHYQPRRNYFGNDLFTYSISDGESLSTAATVAITINPVGDAPSAPQISSPVSGAVILVEGTPIDLIQFTWTESLDPEGDNVTYSWTISSSASLDPVLHNQISIGTVAHLSVSFLANIMDSFGIAFGGRLQLYHQVEATDGSNNSASDVSNFTLERGTITSVQENDDLPTKLTIVELFPNPVSSHLILRYGQPSPGPITISVFDPLGRRISATSSGVQQVGFNTFSIDTNNLSVGLYYVRVSGITEADTQRFVVSR